MKQKIRFRTWYWGNWIWEGESGYTLDQDGFELYEEEKHGWQHSEEAKNGKGKTEARPG